MNDINYITASVLKMLADNPARVVTVLGYVCGLTLLTAMVSDSLLRRRRPTRQKRAVENRLENIRK